jgi:hypothetical protein
MWFVFPDEIVHGKPGNSLPVHFWNERLLATHGHVEQQLMAAHVKMQKLQRGERCCLLWGWTCQLVFGNAVKVQ